MRKILCFIAGLTSALAVFSAETVALKWRVGESLSYGISPKVFYPASVPGAVQLDFAAALKYPDFRYSDNAKVFQKMEDFYYTYVAAFDRIKVADGERLFFFAENIDYMYTIYLNGEFLRKGEGMFTPVEIDITNLQKGQNELRVVIFPVPKADLNDAFGKQARIMFRTLARKSLKPAVTYGWDFQPRIIPSGIAGDAGLRIAAESRLNDVHVNYSLSEDFSKADIMLEVEGVKLAGKRFEWKLFDEDGKQAAAATGVFADDASVCATAELGKPELWWPNGYGRQYLYKSEFKLCDDGAVLQSVSQNVGFKRIKMVANTGAWNKPDTVDKTRSVPPMQFEVNGKRIFVKGSNFISPGIFYSEIDSGLYEKLVAIAADMHLNMFRMWGGAPVAKEPLFDFCDKKGILIWQEFPLACNQYPDDPHYLKILAQEATSIVKRLRKHVCLGRWSGGNELFNGWSKMTEQSLPLRELDSITFNLTPQIPFNYTSPIMGVSHGPYRFMIPTLSPKCDIFEYLPKLHYTAYCEFGVSSMSPVSTLVRIIPSDELFPVRQTKSYIAHHVYRDNTAYRLIDDMHGNIRTANLYCGKSESLSELVANTQFIQAQALGFMFEEMRRQKPYCSAALNWCFNDVWETGANQSIIAYPDIKKQAYYTVKAACRPFLISARPAKFLWKGGEKFSAKLFALNDAQCEYASVAVRARIEFDGKTFNIGEWTTPKIEPYKNAEGPEVSFDIPAGDDIVRFKLIIEADNPKYSSEYTFIRNSKFEYPIDKIEKK